MALIHYTMITSKLNRRFLLTLEHCKCGKFCQKVSILWENNVTRAMTTMNRMTHDVEIKFKLLIVFNTLLLYVHVKHLNYVQFSPLFSLWFWSAGEWDEWVFVYSITPERSLVGRSTYVWELRDMWGEWIR